MKNCIICDKEFEWVVGNQKCCSSECSKILKNQYQKSDKKKEYVKQYKQSEKCKNTVKKYNNSEKGKLTRKSYWINFYNSDEYKESWKKYIQSDLGKVNILKKRLKRKERINNCIHIFTIAEWKQKCEATKGVCPNCNTSFDNNLHKLTIDHIIALYWANEYFKHTGKKLVYTINDVQPLCLSCNCSKQDKIITETKPQELILTC